MQHQIAKLGSDPLGKLLFKFSVPAIANLLINAVYNVIDRVYIGQEPTLGTVGIAAATAAYPIMIISVAIGQLLGMGSATLIAMALGEGRTRDAEGLLGQTFAASVILSVVAGVGAWFAMDPLLVLFGCPAQILPYATSYIQAILVGFVFQVPALALGNTLRSQARPQAAFYCALASALINAALAPLFIYVFRWGMAGAGWATVIAQAFSAIYTFWLIQNDKSHLRIKRERLAPRIRDLGAICKSGMPMALMQLLSIGVMVAANRSVTPFGGDTALAVIGIVYTMAMLFSYPIIGIASGAQSIWGYNMGAKDFRRVERLLKLTLAWCVGLGGAFSLLSELEPVGLVRLFNSQDPTLAEMGARGIKLYMPSFAVFGLILAAVHYFQAVGKATQTLLLLVGKNLFLIAAFFALPPILGLDGAYLSGPASDAVVGVIAVFLLVHAFKDLKLQRVEAEASAARVRA